MDEACFIFAWIWMLVGLLVGAVIGLFFDKDDWLGGYATWRRRLVRLGHIAFLGTGMLNLALALSHDYLVRQGVPMLAPDLAGVAMMIGAITMPLVCFASAAWKPARHAFFVPVIGLVTGVALTTLDACQLVLPQLAHFTPHLPGG